MKPKHQRLLLICAALMGLGLSLSLILFAFQETIIFFYTPSDLLGKKISPRQRIRVGGIVELHSVHQQGNKIRFKVTDQKEGIEVNYQGLLPDLFREGQGIIAEGYLQDLTHFQAETILAKHDEKYMPKEVADRLKQSGLWRDAL